jgi:ABC-type sugar transport system ATPase subunit
MATPPEFSDITATTDVPSANSGAAVETPLLRLRGITKSFGAVQALRHVDLDLPAGKVTALIGDNGAGKSTLIKTISGIWGPTSGTVEWDGRHVEVSTPRDAAALGIATVYQDLALCDNLDVVANMYLGREVTKGGTLDEIEMESVTRQTLLDLSVNTVKSVRQLVGSLSGGQRQAIAIARSVMRDSRLVILDEPTAALGVSQTANVLRLIRTLSDRGIAVLVISHNLSDVFSVADRIAVMYMGRLVSQGPASDYDTQSAVSLITTGEANAAHLSSSH